MIKDIILLVLNIVVVACLLGTIGSLLSYFFGWTIKFKGAEVPGDLRATALFIVMGGLSAAIVYFAGRKKNA
ncbi:MAG: hypothetical protein KIT61_05650 [Pyrinomonadaceae bacterium]|nr:hypothetical protein [Pyrinomonadaceae bacterium]